MENRLKASELKSTRERLWHEQNGICPLCEQYITPDTAVLDHCHKTGKIRGVLHRNCNSTEGRVRSARQRSGMTELAFENFLRNLYEYQTRTYRTCIHPTFRTPEEKVARRAKQAKARRAKSAASAGTPSTPSKPKGKTQKTTEIKGD